jgi:predicted RNA binding protein YcfA (HicA-like mRNA interferase family)
MAVIGPINFKKFEKFLLHIGCKYKRTKGSHVIYDRSDLKRPVVVPKGSEVTTSIVRSNLRTLGLTTQQYSDILKKI